MRSILEKVYPYIGDIKIAKLRPPALENMLAELRKIQHHGKPIKESTVQKYLTVVSAVLSDAKHNKIIQKNPARIIGLPREFHLRTLRHTNVMHTTKIYLEKAGAPSYQKWLDSPGFLFLSITPARSTMPVTV